MGSRYEAHPYFCGWHSPPNWNVLSFSLLSRGGLLSNSSGCGGPGTLSLCQALKEMETVGTLSCLSWRCVLCFWREKVQDPFSLPGGLSDSLGLRHTERRLCKRIFKRSQSAALLSKLHGCIVFLLIHWLLHGSTENKRPESTIQFLSLEATEKAKF